MLNRRLRVEPLEDRRMLAVLTVHNTLDGALGDLVGDDQLSLREAIAIANSPGTEIDGFTSNDIEDTIEFDASLFGSTIELMSGELEITEALTISIDTTFSFVGINANEKSRIFNISSTTGNFRFGRLFLQGGKTSGDNVNVNDTTYSGGAIRSLTSGFLYLNRTDIRDSSTTGTRADGGGVYAKGNVVLIGTQIERNSTVGDFSKGGGVFTEGKVIFQKAGLSGASFVLNQTSGNYAPGGGVFAVDGMAGLSPNILNNSTSGSYSPGGGAFVVGVADLTEADFRYNSTAGEHSMGGAIFVQGVGGTTGNLLLDRGSVENNSTTGNSSAGGAIYSTGAVSSELVTLVDNSTEGEFSHGGAVFAVEGTDFFSSTLSNNATRGESAHGGAVYSLGDIDLEFVTLTSNRVNGVDSIAGGIYGSSSASVFLNHSIVAGNAAAFSPDLWHDSGTIDTRFSLIGSNEGSSLLEAPVFNPDSQGNMIGGSLGEAIKPKLLPLRGLYLPAPDSPVINAGDPSAVIGHLGVPDYDQRGFPFTRIRDGRIDIGSTEIRILRVDTLKDEDDGDHSTGDFSLREALSLVSTTEDQDIIAFDSALFGSGAATIVLTQGELEVVDDVIIYGPSDATLIIDASGNDPTPEENLGDGSRIFNIHTVPSPKSALGTSPHLELYNLTLTGGDVQGDGGAIYFSASAAIGSNSATVHNSLFYENYATGSGGAIAPNSGPLFVVDSTFTENSAGQNGGAISSRVFSFLVDGKLTRGFQVHHSTFTENSAGEHGGGIYLEFGGSVIAHSIIAGNNSSQTLSNEVWQEKFFDTYTDFDFQYSLIGYVSSNILAESPATSPDSEGNIVGGTINGPLAPQLGPLQNNGGPTLTHAPLSGSPAIDAGDPGAMAGLDDIPFTDQRGGLFTRAYDGRIDIGAVEVQPLHADFDEDGDVDGRDFLAWQRGYSHVATATPGDGDANGDMNVDGEDLAAWRNEYGAVANSLGLSVESLVSEIDIQPSTHNPQPTPYWLALPESPVGRSEVADELAVEQVLRDETALDRVFGELGRLPRRVADDLGDLAVHRSEQGAIDVEVSNEGFGDIFGQIIRN